MNPKQANIQTLARLDALEAELKAASQAQGISVDDVKNTIHQIMEILIDVAEAVPVIMADIKRLARGANSVRARIKFFQRSQASEDHQVQPVETTPAGTAAACVEA